MSSQWEIQEFIADMKRPNLQQALELGIPVQGLDDDAHLVPVGHWILAEKRLIAEMATWRFASRKNFFAQFPYSPASMRSYLEGVSIGQPDSLLFMILQSSKFVGHLGLREVRETSVEIDSVMRGTYPSSRGLMHQALRTLLHLAFVKLGVQQACLRALSTNIRARDLYETVGFRQVGLRPLGARLLPDGTTELSPKWATTSPIKEQEVFMSLKRRDWFDLSGPML